MDNPFLNQAEARDYAASIPDRRERLFTEAFLSRAIGHVMRTPDSWNLLVGRGLDLLVLVRVAHDFFRSSRMIEGIQNGTVTSLDDLDEAF